MIFTATKIACKHSSFSKNYDKKYLLILILGVTLKMLLYVPRGNHLHKYVHQG